MAFDLDGKYLTREGASNKSGADTE